MLPKYTSCHWEGESIKGRLCKSHANDQAIVNPAEQGDPPFLCPCCFGVTNRISCRLVLLQGGGGCVSVVGHECRS